MFLSLVLAFLIWWVWGLENIQWSSAMRNKELSRVKAIILTLKEKCVLYTLCISELQLWYCCPPQWQQNPNSWDCLEKVSELPWRYSFVTLHLLRPTSLRPWNDPFEFRYGEMIIFIWSNMTSLYSAHTPRFS